MPQTQSKRTKPTRTKARTDEPQRLDLSEPDTWHPSEPWPGFPRIGSSGELMAVVMAYTDHLGKARLFASLMRDAIREDVPDDVFASDLDRRPKSQIIEDDPHGAYVSLTMAVGSDDEVQKQYPRVHENCERYRKHERGCIMLARAMAIAAEQRGIDSSAIDAALDTRDENVVQRAIDVANRLRTMADAERVNGEDSPDADDADYRPGSWFAEYTSIPAARLRMASSEKRRGKRVRAKFIDGVKCYSIVDARRWWPDSMKPRNA